eukprot:SAG11_NODE_5658_length_1492_cov_4.712850_2_plen_72_part_00
MPCVGLLTRTVYAEAADRAVQHVPRLGAITVFPLLLRLLEPASPRLGDLCAARPPARPPARVRPSLDAHWC